MSFVTTRGYLGIWDGDPGPLGSTEELRKIDRKVNKNTDDHHQDILEDFESE